MPAYTIRVATPSTLVYLGIKNIACLLGDGVMAKHIQPSDLSASIAEAGEQDVYVIDSGAGQNELMALIEENASEIGTQKTVLILKSVSALSLSILRSGHFSAFLESSPVDEMAYVIDSAHRRKRSFSRGVSDAIAMLSIDIDASNLSLLSPREIQVLSYFHKGFQPQEIAARFGISSKTVHVYKSKILEKFNKKRMHEVIAVALRHGLI